jgi:arylformamidase
MPGPFKIIDISQPVTSRTACFPGDVPFSKRVTVTYKESKVVNLTALTMSPHVGTHADAPIHCYGDLGEGRDTAGDMPLQPFIGPAVVVDLSPITTGISPEHFRETIEKLSDFPHRVLFKTAKLIRYEVFEEHYAFCTVEAVKYLADRGVGLIGIDTPSVDNVGSKALDAHAALIEAKMCWLENLDLTNVETGEYFLVAPPLKFMELEASPVRAILIDSDAGVLR